jgi:hypothetical protein
MHRRMLVLVLAIGVSGCTGQGATDAGICIGLGRDIARLRTALETHPETPDAVGEAATDVVIGHEAGCVGRGH